MIFGKLRSWWRGLPTEKRVKLIATILLVLAGTEVVVMAHFIFELAALIDAFGLLFVLGLAGGWLRSHRSMFWMRIVDFGRVGLRWADRVADFGSKFSILWQVRMESACGPLRMIMARAIAAMAVLMIVARLRLWRW